MDRRLDAVAIQFMKTIIAAAYRLAVVNVSSFQKKRNLYICLF
jgi:hypothetical protein